MRVLCIEGTVHEENCVKCLKRGWKRKEGRGNKNFKKGGKLSQGVSLKNGGGGWNPLTNYDLFRAESQEPVNLITTNQIVFA